MDLNISPALPATAPAAPTLKEEALRKAAQELEASFLSEMLKHAGVGETPEAFGGGIGEEQFASLLREEQAREIATNGGIGLADAIFNSLRERSDV